MSLPKDGEYYAMHTLLGSCEIDEATGAVRQRDINRRTICRWPSSEPIVVLNPQFNEWTAEHEADLQRRLDVLNADPATMEGPTDATP